MNYICLCVLFHFFINASSDDEACGPKGIDKKGVNGADIRKILKFHNRFRLKIARGKIKGQPKGLNLYRMNWDTMLSKEAQKHADKCIFAHDKRKDSRFAVGQNLFIKKYSGKPRIESWFLAIVGWFREHKDYAFSVTSNKVVPGPMTGHYTQVIWAKTYLVGCGFSQYVDKKGFTAQLYTCNYGPAGNIQGVAPYKTEGPNKCPRLCNHDVKL